VLTWFRGGSLPSGLALPDHFAGSEIAGARAHRLPRHPVYPPGWAVGAGWFRHTGARVLTWFQGDSLPSGLALLDQVAGRETTHPQSRAPAHHCTQSSLARR